MPSPVQNKKSVFRQLISHRLGLFGIIWVFVCFIIAILGYVITPDNSPLANRINLQAAFLKPMSKVMLYNPRPENDNRVSSFSKIIFGNPQTANYKVYNRREDKADSFYLWYDKADAASFLVAEGLQSQDSKTSHHSFTYYLGSDNYGRDVFSRLLLGTRISLSVGFIAVLISLIMGVSLGLIAGYYGKWADKLIMWLASVIWSLPTLLLVLAISFAIGKGFWQIFVAIGLSSWVELTRVVRGEVISIKEKEYIKAAKLLGVRDFSILFRHILPNVAGSVIVICAANFASAILLEAGLSFLGLGVKPPTPSWGIMINDYYGFILLGKAYLALVPGFAIMMLVVSLNFIGIALRDVLSK
ncbi:MAG: ABC transporter permease [Bacteroidetes bacterium]|nr:ABC transporter permease [Bacteroidota bacterium]